MTLFFIIALGFFTYFTLTCYPKVIIVGMGLIDLTLAAIAIYYFSNWIIAILFYIIASIISTIILCLVRMKYGNY